MLIYLFDNFLNFPFIVFQMDLFVKTGIWIPVLWMITTYCFHAKIGPVLEEGIVLIMLSSLIFVTIPRGIFHGTKPFTT